MLKNNYGILVAWQSITLYLGIGHILPGICSISFYKVDICAFLC
jgi:hypothetical protein